MKVVFLSNFYNHHQSELCEQLHKQTGGDFYFIQYRKMSEERGKLGWGQQEVPSYVVNAFGDEQQAKYAQTLINEADVLILGADEKKVEQRLIDGKLTFKYTERIYKEQNSVLRRIVHSIRYRIEFCRYKNFYLLCAGAYVSMDFWRNGVFHNKAYKWGYFPAVKRYERIKAIVEKKERNSILWVGRFIEYKHPEIVVEIAKKLKNEGVDFHIRMIGIGELEEKIRSNILDEGLQGEITMCGAMSPDEVRSYMEKSSIFLFTSDFGEGWGAVLNESMNSGCAVVASHAIGAAPYLVRDGINGCLYRNGNYESLYNKVVTLLKNKEYCSQLGLKAYDTITNEWNAEIAAKRFIQLSKSLLVKGCRPINFEKGICSSAERMANDWYE